MLDRIAATFDRVNELRQQSAPDDLLDDKSTGLSQTGHNTIGLLLATPARTRRDLAAKLSGALLLLEGGCVDDDLGEGAVKILRAFDLPGDVERLDQARRAAMARDAAQGSGVEVVTSYEI
jgi:hypothetical protein